MKKKDLAFEELSECFPDAPGLSDERLLAVLNSFLRRSKPGNADMFLKRYYFQSSISDIAEEYGIGENHVRSILSKMRNRLKKAFKEEV